MADSVAQQRRSTPYAPMFDRPRWESNVSVEDGVEQIAGNAIAAPSGKARSVNSTSGNEQVTYRCNLAETTPERNLAARNLAHEEPGQMRQAKKLLSEKEPVAARRESLR